MDRSIDRWIYVSIYPYIYTYSSQRLRELTPAHLLRHRQVAPPHVLSTLINRHAPSRRDRARFRPRVSRRTPHPTRAPPLRRRCLRRIADGQGRCGVLRLRGTLPHLCVCVCVCVCVCILLCVCVHAVTEASRTYTYSKNTTYTHAHIQYAMYVWSKSAVSDPAAGGGDAALLNGLV